MYKPSVLFVGNGQTVQNQIIRHKMPDQAYLAVPRGCLQFVIVVFHDHTHLLFLQNLQLKFGKNK